MFFWLGPKGAKTPLHRDLGNVFLVQVWGRKLWGDYAPTAGVPLFASRSECACLWDVDGHRYIDCALGYGPARPGPAAIRHCSIAGMLSLRNVLST